MGQGRSAPVLADLYLRAGAGPARPPSKATIRRVVTDADAGVEAGDIAEAVAERIGRQGYLLQRDRQFVFVIEEPVLRFRPCSTAVQRDQLTHLPGMMMLPSVSFGIIPMGTDQHGHRAP